MYRLRKMNVERIVASMDEANKLVSKGFDIVSQPLEKSESDDGVLNCPHCEKTYKTQEGLDRHIAEKHPEKLQTS